MVDRRQTKSHGTSAGPALRRDAEANRERVLAAATAAVKREGDKVPLATIAADAGVGIGTLYRRYPTREALLAALTDRSFRLVLDVAVRAAELEGPALASIGQFLDQTIDHRDELVLPLHGGPAALDESMNRLSAGIRHALEEILARGRRDGSIRANVTATDIIIMGAMLARPLPHAPDWDPIARRQMAVYLDGLSMTSADA